MGADLEDDLDTLVYVVNEGVVRLTEEFINKGKTIAIDQGLGIYSLYLHLDEFKVSEGKKVKRGDIIALSGNSGHSTSPHLHSSVKINAQSLDPLRFIEITKKRNKLKKWKNLNI